MMLGILPAAGAASRIQPLAFSKEVLPVGTRRGTLEGYRDAIAQLASSPYAGVGRAT